jgi:hypothetical protein
MIVGLNRKEKSTADASEGSETVSDNEDERYEWVEKTHETLGLSTAYRAETNGRSWDGAYKSDVTNHLTNLSHQGYGSANGKSHVLTCGILFFSLVHAWNSKTLKMTHSLLGYGIV